MDNPPLQQPLKMLAPPLPQPPLPPHQNVQPPNLNLDSKISPSIILIIIILAIIFFVSGLLHLVVRFLLRPNQRNPDEFAESVTALQGQLQQLFHLHDAGVDQSYIDTLPVFQYKAIIGLKDPFDCAVCLCEFEPDDKLRLLPKCSHAFHVDCIDTWLLSHSTCPLCRASLLQDFGAPTTNSPHGFSLSPVVCVLESGSNTVESSRELEREVVGSGLIRDEFGSNRSDLVKSHENIDDIAVKKDDKIVMVKLGKFRNVEGGEGSSDNIVTNNSNNDQNNNNNSSGSNNLGSRRCYSMGSFAYVMDETTSLQVPIRTPAKKASTSRNKSKGGGGGGKVANRGAMSEYGCDSRREFNGIEAFRTLDLRGNNSNNNNNVGGSSGSIKKESFSFSKIWLRGSGEKNKKLGNMNGNHANPRSGNLNGNGNGNEINRSSRRTTSEFEIDVSELGIDEETQSCYSVDSLANPTTTSSSTRRTLMWLMGRQNKIVHNHSSSFSSNV
ncbi:RING-H2 finger protein ATL13-like [Chenopodium quinoa]|uniref:RING-H2 finger protein ATL13-like n=1 Tax=Chenopodium quinoa TaxID=63459 RepID=UPI000B77E14A|nr:RING-H2 finger protein ATL13-like [Chenopodium quinoa]